MLKKVVNLVKNGWRYGIDLANITLQGHSMLWVGIQFFFLSCLDLLKSKHDGGVVSEVKQSFLHCHCEPKAWQSSSRLISNRLPRRYAPRNDGGAVSKGLPCRCAPRNDDNTYHGHSMLWTLVHSQRIQDTYSIFLKRIHHTGCSTNWLSPKVKHDSNVCGRSMIEMLGVLAIIGVLSVGGLAGYSKAMIKFKTNKTIDEIVTIVSNIQTLFANQKTYEGTAADCDANGNGICEDEFDTGYSSDLEFLKNADVFPEDMIVNDKLINPFNGDVWVGSWKPKYLFIVFDSLPKEACIMLATYDWGNSSSSYVGLNVVTTNWGNTTHADCYPGYDRNMIWDDVENGELSACVWDEKIPNPVPPEIAAQGCNCRSNTCKISIQFDEYNHL